MNWPEKRETFVCHGRDTLKHMPVPSRKCTAQKYQEDFIPDKRVRGNKVLVSYNMFKLKDNEKISLKLIYYINSHAFLPVQLPVDSGA